MADFLKMIRYTNCVTICKVAVTVTDMKRVINEQVADQVRELLVNEPDMDEKTMFSGHCFLVNGKMCVCVNLEDLLCRIGHERVVEELEKGMQTNDNERAGEPRVIIFLLRLIVRVRQIVT
jgi:hypothetical protein